MLLRVFTKNLIKLFFSTIITSLSETLYFSISDLQCFYKPVKCFLSFFISFIYSGTLKYLYKYLADFRLNNTVNIFFFKVVIIYPLIHPVRMLLQYFITAYILLVKYILLKLVHLSFPITSIKPIFSFLIW